MEEQTTEQELKERLSLIESMIAEGRRGTERWGWTFVLWGVAYYVAIAWSVYGRSDWAWPVTMVAAAAITAIGASRTRYDHPGTLIGRAMGAIWAAVGVALFLTLFVLAFTGRFELHVFIVIVGGMLGVANSISGTILRWKMQGACAFVWWSLAVAVCFVSTDQAVVLFLAAIFLCQIVFGVYAMISESRRRSRQGATHA
ncbi:MAG: hypothetical protein ACRD3N_00770 [Terracidiphilus sp.]